MTDRPFPKPHRLPHEAYSNLDATFHFTVDAFPETWPFREDRVAAMVWTTLTRELERDSIVLVAACLMPNHLHLVARPLARNLADWVADFKSLTTRRAWRLTGRAVLWQPSSWDRRLYEREVGTVVAYIVRNPEVAGLVEDGSDWRWVGVWAED